MIREINQSSLLEEMRIILYKKINNMFLKEEDFHEHVLYIRKHAKELWVSLSNSGAMNSFKTFKPTMVRYSRIDKKYIYSDLGYYAHSLDYLNGIKKLII